MDANFADSNQYDRVVTLGFDWDGVVPRVGHGGVRNLYRYLKRNAAHIGAASREGLEFGIHALDAIVGAGQVRLHRLLQWLVSGILALLVVRSVAGFVVLRPAVWYGLPTVGFAPMQWLAAASEWLENGIVIGVILLIVLSGLRLLLTLSPRPAIVTFRSIALLFLQPVIIVTIAALAADTVLLWTFFGVLGLPVFLLSSTGALVRWGLTLVAVLALRSSWGRRSIGEPIEAMLDVCRYLGEPGFRSRIQHVLDKAIVRSRKRSGEDREFVLSGQGMGTVIALDSILHSREWRDTDRVLLVTMASPLRRYFLRYYPRTLFPESMEDLIDSIVRRLDEFRWINVHRPGDYMGADLGLKPFKGRDLSTGLSGRRTIAHADYWSSLDARHALHDGLAGLKPVGLPPVPKKDLEDYVPMKDPEHYVPIPRKSLARFSISPLARRLFWTSLLLGTFGWTLQWVATGSGVLVSEIYETPELLVRRGVVVEAAATHRRETVETDRGVTYVDHWDFNFTDPTGTAKRLHVQNDVSEAFLDMDPLRFDGREFTRQIRAGCALGDQPPSWWTRRDMKTPCTMEEVRLRYYPRDEVLLDLPDFPPPRALRDPVRGWTEAGVVAAALTVLLLVSVVTGLPLFVAILG
jgi:hypothetical protein